MNTTSTVTINADDAIEIIEAFHWLRDWFAHDPEPLARSLRRYSFGLLTVDELADDLARFDTILGDRQ